MRQEIKEYLVYILGKRIAPFVGISLFIFLAMGLTVASAMLFLTFTIKGFVVGIGCLATSIFFFWWPIVEELIRAIKNDYYDFLFRREKNKND